MATIDNINVSGLTNKNNFLNYLQIGNFPLAGPDSAGKNEFSLINQKLNSPKITFFENRIAALENGVAALAVKSLKSARFLLIKSLLEKGNNVVFFNSSISAAEQKLYARIGIGLNFVKNGNLQSLQTLVNEETKLILVETYNHQLDVAADFNKIIRFAKENNIPVAVDNTAGVAGYLVSPIREGANVVIESTYDWLNYKTNLIGAVIIDGGNYDWHEKFAHLKYLDVEDGYEIDKSGLGGFSLINYIRKGGNINYSKYPIPGNPLSLVQILEDLPSNIQLSSQLSLEFSKWLKTLKFIKNLNYLGLPENRNYYTALTYFRSSFGNIISFKPQVFSSSFYAFKDTFIRHLPARVHVWFEDQREEVIISIKETPVPLLKHALFATFQELEDDLSLDYLVEGHFWDE